MTIRFRFILIAAVWLAMAFDMMHPGQFRFYLVHDGGPFQIDFSGDGNGG